MNLKNVEVLENTETTQKNRWYHKFSKKMGISSAVVTSAVVATQAHALDVSTALSGSDVEANIETGAVFVLGVILVIWGAKKVIGFFGR